jgi:integrase
VSAFPGGCAWPRGAWPRTRRTRRAPAPAEPEHGRGLQHRAEGEQADGQRRQPDGTKTKTSLVLELADAIGTPYRAIVLLAGFAGLRTGESLGLRRADIDLLHGEIRIHRQAQEITGCGRAVLAPKSEAGRRTVALPAVVVESLEQHSAAFTSTDAEAPVFTGPKSGPLRRATFSRAWRAAVSTTGAPAGLRPHDLRTMPPR